MLGCREDADKADPFDTDDLDNDSAAALFEIPSRTHKETLLEIPTLGGTPADPAEAGIAQA